ncbi:MAG: 2,3-bisphosphoglycerate-independent phosphoglycerate mutase [Bacteroidetes bacterium]|nr:2,3-bisphosphoglycerate-independent phosphoglycerate mutase [Bacteroidota bacterium]
MSKRKVCLIIMDGWGHGPNNDKVNAILSANTPFVDGMYKQFPNSELLTCGLHVGLPDGQMGNSEVGHLNIGAGRVVYQQLVLINNAFSNGSISQNQVLLNAAEYAKSKGKKVHLLGLVSDGGIHSHINHFKGLIEFFKNQNAGAVYVHAFTDGRDTDPKSGAGFIKELADFGASKNAQIASIIGRYYSMDRDFKWDRIKLAYDAMVNGIGNNTNDLIGAIESSYAEGTTDEFLQPIVNSACGENGKIEPGDVVINVNFRTDRGRQISRALTQESFADFGIEPIDIKYITLTEYDATYNNVEVVFENDNLQNTLGEVLTNQGKTQLRIAETEKYPHVTFFFSGGRETPFEGEERIICQSPKVATYDLAPEMSAQQVAEEVIVFSQKNHPDFIALNFANADMVGHTGDFAAVEKAVEEVDRRTEQVVTELSKLGYSFLITADHGNADYEVNDDGSPNTAHTTNPVPCFLIDALNEYAQLNNGKLADLAPTVLKLMEIEQPTEMTGNSLI